MSHVGPWESNLDPLNEQSVLIHFEPTLPPLFGRLLRGGAQEMSSVIESMPLAESVEPDLSLYIWLLLMNEVSWFALLFILGLKVLPGTDLKQ